MAGGGNAIRGSRVGAGPMGEAERGESEVEPDGGPDPDCPQRRRLPDDLQIPSLLDGVDEREARDDVQREEAQVEQLARDGGRVHEQVEHVHHFRAGPSALVNKQGQERD